MDNLCYLCLVFVMLLRLFVAALWSPAGKGLTSWLPFVILTFNNRNQFLTAKLLEQGYQYHNLW